MNDNSRIFVLFLLNLLVYFAAGEANNVVASWSVTLHADSLMIVFFGLFLKRYSGLLYTCVLGLLAGAIHPVSPGTYLVPYLGQYMFFVWCQRRIRLQHPVHVRTTAAIAQALFILVLAFILGRGQLGSGGYWGRILIDLLISSGMAYLLAFHWCSFQKNLLYSLGWDLESEPPTY